MNRWTERSKELVYSNGYLDKILEIYPINENELREIPFEDEQLIRGAYHNRNIEELISLLNGVVRERGLRFPIECLYAQCLREDNLWFERNPEVKDKIGNLLLNIKINKLIKNCIVPIKPSRQLGNAFNIWFQNKFSNNPSIEFLGESDAERKSRAVDLIGYNRDEKNVNLFVRINGIYIIGEAKFITNDGGNQKKSFREALNISSRYSRPAGVIALSIVDGYCWHRSRIKMYRTIEASNDSQIIISALLLEELFNRISNDRTLSGEDIENNSLVDII